MNYIVGSVIPCFLNQRTDPCEVGIEYQQYADLINILSSPEELRQAIYDIYANYNITKYLHSRSKPV